MVAPLIYAGKEIGVVCVADKSLRGGFTQNDFEVFQSIAEQSSFALGSALIHQEAHEKQALDKELKTASEIQKILLPFSSPKLDDFVVAAVNHPAKTVSGDYFDYITVDESHFGIVIGDVSGKGIPASLIMAMCRSVVRVKAAENLSPSSVLDGVNRAIFDDIREDMFITMAYIILEKNSNRVTLVRAGHDPPLLYRKADESVEMIKPPGLAVGIDSGDVFQRVTHDYSFDMESGDTLLLYTDGATEALDKNGDEYGLARIEKAVAEASEQGAQAVIDRICSDLRAFLADVPQNDDITLIALQKR
jgi:sigma-B regulation protein RsbU (phosphoserine phosphatase)